MDAVMNFAVMFIDEFVTLFAQMAPFLLLGFLLAGVIHVWIPNHLYIPKISKLNFKSVLWAALVLLMAGPATSIASMLVVGKAFGKRTLVAYLVSIAAGALFFGFIVDTFFMDTFLSTMLPGGANGASAAEIGHGALGIFDYVSAGFLALLMIYSRIPKRRGKHCCCDEHDRAAACDADLKTDKVASTHTYRVFGMNCSHCKMCVEKAAMKLDGVTFATADIAKKQLEIEGSVDEAELKTAIEAAGFEFGGRV